MTVSSTNTKRQFNGDGSTAAFAYNFKVFADADLQVIVRSATGTESVKSSGTHYNASGVGETSGGTVTFTSGNIPASGETITLRRAKTVAQELDLVANDPFPAANLENQLDKMTHLILQNNEELDRALKLSRTNTMTSTEFVNSATDRANKVLSFDASGELAVAQELGTFKGNWAASTAYVVRDIVKDTSTNNIFIAITAHSSSGSQPITTNTDSAKWSLIVDAATATTSATTATNKAADASKLAITAEDSQYTLSDGSTQGYSALHYSAKATASASAASTSATAAATSLATFQGQYYGALSSAPTSNLATGDLYFHTGQGIKVFNGSAFEDVKPTSDEQTAINALSASAVLADMAILATDAIVADLAILGSDAIVADLEILATSSNVTAMGLLGTAAVVEDMGLLGTSAVISDMATLAGSGGSPNLSAISVSGNANVAGEVQTTKIAFTDGDDAMTITDTGLVEFNTGFNIGSDAAGDVLYNNGSKYVRLAKGTDGQALVLASGVPSWAAVTTDISGKASLDGATFTGAIQANGGVVFNEGSADVDFRVESNGNANMLFVDGGNNAVGIGTTNVDADNNFTVLGNFNSNFIRNVTSGNRGYIINIGAVNGSGTNIIGAQLIGEVKSGDADGAFSINTRASGSLSEKIRIDSAGKIGIGTTAPNGVLEVHTAQNTTNQFTTPHITLDTSTTTNSTGFTGIAYSTSTGPNYGITAGALRSQANGKPSFVINTHEGSASGTERFRVTDTGNVGIGTSSPDVFSRSYSGTTTGISSASGETAFMLNSSGTNVTALEMGRGGTRELLLYDKATQSEFFTLVSKPLIIGTNGTEAMRIDTAGIVTKPLQPAFMAIKNADQNNIAASTPTTITWQTEIYDVNADFASNTFTAPVTGKYLFAASILLSQPAQDAEYIGIRLVTSNRNHRIGMYDFVGFDAELEYWSIKGSVIVDMDASDTAFLQFYQSGGTGQTDIKQNDDTTVFTGYLLG